MIIGDPCSAGFSNGLLVSVVVEMLSSSAVVTDISVIAVVSVSLTSGTRTVFDDKAEVMSPVTTINDDVISSEVTGEAVVRSGGVVSSEVGSGV